MSRLPKIQPAGALVLRGRTMNGLLCLVIILVTAVPVAVLLAWAISKIEDPDLRVCKYNDQNDFAAHRRRASNAMVRNPRTGELQPVDPLKRFPGSNPDIAVVAAAFIDESDRVVAERRERENIRKIRERLIKEEEQARRKKDWSIN